MRKIAGILARLAITAAAFWWIFKTVNLGSLLELLRKANPAWLAAAVGLYFLAQLTCISRWKLLVPQHPALTWRFLANSFFVGSFFNTVLPTTVGGDVVRSYDLIKATGQWRPALASVLMDRLAGMAALVALALAAWFALPTVRWDPVLRTSFLGFCAVVAVSFCVLGSRRVLQASLRPFGKIGLGQLQVHAKQFQESLLAFFKQPRVLLAALGISLLVQTMAILMFQAASEALRIPVSPLFLALMVPIVALISQIPISLNGWGIREGATILLLQRVGVEPPQALSLSLICAAIPTLSGIIGGVLFLLRRRKRPARV